MVRVEVSLQNALVTLHERSFIEAMNIAHRLVKNDEHATAHVYRVDCFGIDVYTLRDGQSVTAQRIA